MSLFSASNILRKSFYKVIIKILLWKTKFLNRDCLKYYWIYNIIGENSD